jgi:hypothetical protein
VAARANLAHWTRQAGRPVYECAWHCDRHRAHGEPDGGQDDEAGPGEVV